MEEINHPYGDGRASSFRNYMIYTVLAKVDQVVTRNIKIEIEAESDEEADNVAREALHQYPEPLELPGVRNIVTQKATYWIPRDITLEIKGPENVAA